MNETLARRDSLDVRVDMAQLVVSSLIQLRARYSKGNKEAPTRA